MSMAMSLRFVAGTSTRVGAGASSRGGNAMRG